MYFIMQPCSVKKKTPHFISTAGRTSNQIEHQTSNLLKCTCIIVYAIR